MNMGTVTQCEKLVVFAITLCCVAAEGIGKADALWRLPPPARWTLDAKHRGPQVPPNTLPETLDALRRMGHEITVQDAFSGCYNDRPFGRGQIILFADESRKVLVGGTDPRGDGCIMGI
jgi:hypothetical protein